MRSLNSDNWVRFCLIVISLQLISPFVLAADDLEKQRALFIKAESALRKNRFSEFNDIRKQLGDYPLNIYLHYLRLGKKPLATQEIKQFIEKNPESRFTPKLRRKLLTHLGSKRNWREYVSIYQPTTNTTLQCLYFRALLQTGKSTKAFDGAQALWLVGRSQPKQCDPLFAAWRGRGKLTKGLVWKRVEMAIGRGNIRLAGYLKRFLPVSEQAVAERWLEVHRTPKLLADCSALKNTDERKGSIFTHGIVRLARRDSVLARKIWEARSHEVDITPPKRAYIQQRLALGLAVDRSPGALEYLASIDLKSTDDKMLAWTVRAALFQRRWQQALKALDSLNASQKAKPRWKYWRARVLDELGEKKLADALFEKLTKERDFYGFLAADRLEEGYALANRSVDISDTELRDLEDRLPFRTAYEFRHFKRETEARRQWWHAIQAFEPRQLTMAAKIAQKWDWNPVAILTIARAKFWDDLELRFPLGFNDGVVKYAEKQDLDPAIVFALIRRESAFDRDALSPAGARGLMQLMPATGRNVARSLGHSWKSANRLYDPETNLRYGTVYFKRMLERFDQNFVLAAAAYNAGPHRVVRWLPKEKPVPADIWIETIPFEETRRYVNAVLAYSVIYHERLKRKPRRITAYLENISPGEPTRKKVDAPIVVAACK